MYIYEGEDRVVAQSGRVGRLDLLLKYEFHIVGEVERVYYCTMHDPNLESSLQK